MAQGFQEIDAEGCEPDLRGVSASLLEKVERQCMIGIAKRRDADGLAFQGLDARDRARCSWSSDDCEQRKPAGDRKAADIRTRISVGCDGDVKRSCCIVDSAADQGLHCSTSTASINQFGIEPVVLEVAAGARDFVRHSA